MSWAADFQNFFVLVYGPGLSWLLPVLLGTFVLLALARFFIRVFLPRKY